jgi:glucan 1,3-beta-glucosidase
MTPLWSYQLGLQNGWMPKDPRAANGTCDSYGYNYARFNNSFAPYQTGGGDGTIVASASSSFGQWPPPTISAFPSSMAYSLAPTYSATGSMSTLAYTLPASATPSATGKGGKATATSTPGGWADASDTAARYTPVADCTYPDPWTIGPTTTVVCTGSATATLGSMTAGGSVTPLATPPTPAAIQTARRR